MLCKRPRGARIVHVRDDNAFSFCPSKNLHVTNEHHPLDVFHVYSMPASGPRGFCTMGFDEAFTHAVRGGGGQIAAGKWLQGGSFGSLRFCAILASIISGKDVSKEAVMHLTEMTYHDNDTPAVLSPMMEKLIDICAPTELLQEMIDSPHHLAIMVARFPQRFSSYPDWKLKLVFVSLIIANFVHPSLRKRFFNRVCFYTGPKEPSYMMSANNSDIQFVPITLSNFRKVLLATTCIPFVSERVTDIPDAPAGLYFDAAISDWKVSTYVDDASGMQMLYLADEPDDVRVKQSFLDQTTPWRGNSDSFFDNCSTSNPTNFFSQELKLPDVNDWFDKAYVRNPSVRKASWAAVYDMSLRRWRLDFAEAMRHMQSSNMDRRRKQNNRLYEPW